MIKWFNDLSLKQINEAGGKAANLGEMTKANFNVPPGFCILADAYRDYVKETGLLDKIYALLAKRKSGDISSLESDCQKIQELIISNAISDKMKNNLHEAYKTLCEMGFSSVAVRSSSTAEDLPEASFAGQQETYLNVRGEENLLTYVKKCWASLWTARAVAYREKQGYSHFQVALAVVIQAMVDSEFSGVLFTMNPITGRKNEFLINATYGLGEALVSGQVTPDEYRITRQGKIIEQKIGHKLIQFIPDNNGLTISQPVSNQLQDRLCLDKAGLQQLKLLGLQVEKYYGTPQDIEWAVKNGKLYLIQTRPITTVDLKQTVRPAKLSGLKQKINDSMLEHYPEPPYPLEFETIMAVQESRNLVFTKLGLNTPPKADMIKLTADAVPYINPVPPVITPKVLGILFHIQKMVRESLVGCHSEEEQKLHSEVKKLKQLISARLEKTDIICIMKDIMRIVFGFGRIRFQAYIFPLYYTNVLLNICLAFFYRKGKINTADFLGNLDSITSGMNKTLNILVKTAYDTGIAEQLITQDYHRFFTALKNDAHPFMLAWEKFMEDYGARALKAYLPFTNLSWRENPEPLYEMIQAMVRSGIKEGADKNAENNYKLRIEQLLAGLPRFLHKYVLKKIHLVRECFIGRESTLYGIEECFYIARSLINRIKPMMAADNIIKDENDILYLRYSEVILYLEGKLDNPELLITRRKDNWINKSNSLWYANKHPKVEDNATDILKGIAGCPGICTGKVKVVKGQEEFDKLQKGDILVCSFTDPAWTPLFTIASAVISDTGGTLSHAAIVAREYGIPAVLATQKATTRLRDNDMVTVDGDKGIVYIGKNGAGN